MGNKIPIKWKNSTINSCFNKEFENLGAHYNLTTIDPTCVSKKPNLQGWLARDIQLTGWPKNMPIGYFWEK